MAPARARSVRWRSAGAVLVLGSASAGIAPAGAVDWQLLYSLSETLSVSDNLQLSPDSEGVGFSSSTSGGLDFAALTPTAEWRTSGNIGHLIYFGEGIPEDRERTTFSATTALLKRTIRTDLSLSANFSMAPATQRVFTGPVLVDPNVTDPVPVEPGVTDPVLADLETELLNFDRISYGARAGLTHLWTPVDTLALSVSVARADFTGEAPDVSPHTDLDFSGTWSRRLTRRVDGRLRGSVGYFESEDDEQRFVYDLAVGANVRATRRLTVDFNAGVNIVDLSSAGEGGSMQSSDISAGFTGDFTLVYTPWRDTQVTLAISESVTPDGLGNLRSGQAVSGAVSYRINELSSFNVTGSLSNSSEAGDGGDSTQAWIVSPTYTHALTRDWNLALTYRWVKTDTAQSNTALLTLSHQGAILP